MKLFWLTAEMPFPPNTGGRIGMFKRIEYFSTRNEIYLFSIIDSEKERMYKDSMQAYCKEVRLYNRKKQKWGNFHKLLKGPYICVSRWLSEMQKDIDAVYETVQPDFVIVDFPQMLGNISDRVMKSGKVILNQHNIEYMALRNMSSLHKNILIRCASLIESYRLQWLEEQYYKRNLITLYTFVSIDDKTFFEEKYGLRNTLLVPVGTEACKLEKPFTSDFTISYMGKMEYPPNAEAAVWFAKNVYNRLKLQIPNLKYYIVGKNPLVDVCNLNKLDKSIIVTGTVEDVKEYFAKSDLIVVPLFHGGGVKVKLLEALGYGKLVITTSKGIEGTSFQNNKELLVADNPDDFTRLCVDVYNNSERYSHIKETAFRRIKKEFTWQMIIKNFENELNNLLQYKQD